MSNLITKGVARSMLKLKEETVSEIKNDTSALIADYIEKNLSQMTVTDLLKVYDSIEDKLFGESGEPYDIELRDRTAEDLLEYATDRLIESGHKLYYINEIVDDEYYEQTDNDDDEEVDYLSGNTDDYETPEKDTPLDINDVIEKAVKQARNYIDDTSKDNTDEPIKNLQIDVNELKTKINLLQEQVSQSNITGKARTLNKQEKDFVEGIRSHLNLSELLTEVGAPVTITGSGVLTGNDKDEPLEKDSEISKIKTDITGIKSDIALLKEYIL